MADAQGSLGHESEVAIGMAIAFGIMRIGVFGVDEGVGLAAPGQPLEV
nr:hypothetical protein [Pseudomonas sp. A46]